MNKGRAFLETYFPQQFSQVGTYEGNSLQGEGVVLVRQANGVPFPENYYRMSFDKQTGALLSFQGQWDEDVTFAGKEGIISQEEAESIWKEAHPVELGYSAAPTDQGDKLMLPISIQKKPSRFMVWMHCPAKSCAISGSRYRFPTPM